MGTLTGLRTLVRCRVRTCGTERLSLSAACFVGFLTVMLASCGVGAQETSPDAESDDMALDLFEADRPDEEVPARKRLILEVPRLAPEEEESRPEGSEQTAVVPPAAESEHELREVVQELQEDVEMLKEEIAQLRSELRNLMPKDSQDETVVKRTVNPFWISDAQLKQLQEG